MILALSILGGLALTLVGALLIAVGCVYLRWPRIWRRGIWLHTSLAIRFLSEKTYDRYMRALGALHVALGVVVLGCLWGPWLGAAAGMHEIHGPERGQLDVVVDPSTTSDGALHVGENPRAPRENTDTKVRVRREAADTLVVDVRVVRNEYWFVTRFTLRGAPGEVVVHATSHSAQGDSTHYRWPSRGIRGSMTLNHDELRDLTGRPLVLHSDVTGWRSGSDVNEKLAIEVTETDLR